MANPISTRRNKYPELCTFCSPKLHKILLGTAHPLHICQLIVEAVLCFISLLNMVSAVMSRLHNRALFLRKGISLRLSIALFPFFFSYVEQPLAYTFFYLPNRACQTVEAFQHHFLLSWTDITERYA